MQTYEYLEMKYVIFARETLPNDDDNVLKKPFGWKLRDLFTPPNHLVGQKRYFFMSDI